MEAAAQNDTPLDHNQVKKAVQALQAYLKSISSSKKLLDETQKIGLLVTFWKVPKKEQTIRIPLPHAIRNDSAEVCLFTRDEPNMTAEQTEKFYKRLLSERGVNHIPQVMSFKTLRTEYKPFEAKRRLLSNFVLFLSDARIRFRLPSHIGKHFYERKKAPLSVDLESKHLARDMDRLIQGTNLCVNKKGSCCMVFVAHSGMSADEIVENIVATVNTVSSKIQMKGKIIKTIHLKSQTSVALPIYTSDLSHLKLVEEELQKARLLAETQKTKKTKSKFKKNTMKTPLNKKGKKSPGDVAAEEEIEEEEEEKEITVKSPSKKPKLKGMKKMEKKTAIKSVLKKNTKSGLKKKGQVSQKDSVAKEDMEEEEIPQLVPIESPSKKPKLEIPSKMGRKRGLRPATVKGSPKSKQGGKKPGRKSLRQKKVSAV